MLTDEEKDELRAIAASGSMRRDSKLLSESRFNPFTPGGEVDCDRVIEFLTDYNEFLNHPTGTRRPFMEKKMLL
jgi:hypothetical protein